MARVKGTAMVSWDAELAKAAEIAAAQEQKAGGSFLSTRGGQLSYQGNPIAGNTLDVVILDSIFVNAFYDEDFDPDSPRSPVCSAFSHEEDELAPTDEVEARQNETCEGCPNNEWGSADKGKGKACKNSRRLALIPADSLDELADAEVAYLELPVTSTKGWASYVQTLAATMKRPPFGVITQVSLVPDTHTQYKVAFKVVDKLSPAHAGALLEKRKEVASAIMFPYRKNAPKVAKPMKKVGKALVNKRRKF